MSFHGWSVGWRVHDRPLFQLDGLANNLISLKALFYLWAKEENQTSFLGHQSTERKKGHDLGLPLRRTKVMIFQRSHQPL
jgi:hypothetical protein